MDTKVMKSNIFKAKGKNEVLSNLSPAEQKSGAGDTGRRGQGQGRKTEQGHSRPVVRGREEETDQTVEAPEQFLTRFL